MNNLNKEIWNVPLSTKEIVMEDKNFPINLYAKMMLESNRNENDDNKYRYIYKNKMKEKVEPYFLEGQNKISKKTYDKYFRYLKKVDFDLVKPENTINGIVYKLKFKDDNNRKFITIKSDVLNKLIECSNANVLKVYLILLYTLTDEEGHLLTKQVSRSWLCKKIGFSEKSLDRMTVILNFLSDDLHLINIEIREGMYSVLDKNKNYKEVYKTPYFISLKTD
ncbi:MAG: hypothetical protein ACRC6T_05360 [Sarcina sp.]